MTVERDGIHGAPESRDRGGLGGADLDRVAVLAVVHALRRRRAPRAAAGGTARTRRAAP